MITIDCRELTVDEQLALAAAISDSFGGRLLALTRDELIVLDVLTDPRPTKDEIETVVKGFISRRKDSQHYSEQWEGDKLVVHSADPLARSRGRKRADLPPNMLKCPIVGGERPSKNSTVCMSLHMDPWGPSDRLILNRLRPKPDRAAG